MTATRKTAKPLPADAHAIAGAAAALARGELVIFPTETVYGLGADATNDDAVAAIFEAKGRPTFNPLIVHLPKAADAHAHAQFDAAAERLAAAFWPGPFTLVLPLRPCSPLSPRVSAGLSSVALRVPAHPVAQRLLARFAGPIAAPSANRSGRVSPTTAAHAMAELGDRAACILDGGPCDKGLESTIVGLFSDHIEVYRPGSITSEDIAAVSGLAVRGSGPSPMIVSPGQLASHYAPDSQVRLGVTAPEADEALLAFGPEVPRGARLTLNLSPGGDLSEAARNLFAMLRRLDHEGAGRIAVMPIPERGVGLAINDRLRRAAAPRPKRTAP